MKLYHIEDVEKFMKTIDACEGRVELVTGEGDRLNLKSKLSQYVSLAKLLSAEGEEIPEMELLVSDAKDAARLISYMAG